jgi:hypothetical protein
MADMISATRFMNYWVILNTYIYYTVQSDIFTSENIDHDHVTFSIYTIF